MKVNLNKFINKTVYHGICRISPDKGGTAIDGLPVGAVFTGAFYSSIEVICVTYVAEVNRPTRNFRFKVVKNGEPYLLPHNMAFLHSVPVGSTCYNVYVEKEL